MNAFAEVGRCDTRCFRWDGRSPVPSRSGSPVGVSGGDAAFPQSVQRGGRVDAQVFADLCQCLARVVQADRVVDLAGGEAALAHVHAVPAQNCTHRSSVDAEPITQLVGCRTAV